jgi:hypothetical protein
MGCLFEPASDCIPGNLLYSGDCGLVQALDAQGGNFVEGRATMLESMVRCVFYAGTGIAGTMPGAGLCRVKRNRRVNPLIIR